MRVLLTTLHLNPLVPIARALEEAGHEVAFACSRDERPAVEGAGFRYVPAGTSIRELMPQIMTIPEEQRDTWMMTNAFAKIMPERMMTDLWEICREWQPDLVLRDSTELGGCVVAERLGIPHASVEVGMFISAPLAAHLTGENIAALRESAGLSPDPELEMLYRYLHLSFVPPSYQDPAFPHPPTAHAFKPVIFDQSGDERLPEWVEGLPDRPTIYATLGTTYNKNSDNFRAIIDGLREENVNLIVTIGRDQDPAQFGPQPEHIHIERYIPQSLLLPHCDLIICHGGWNTVIATLGYGLPLVLLPLGADQPWNAERAARLGAGIILAPDKRTPDAIRTAARTVLHDPAYRHNAKRVRAEMNGRPDIAAAVALLEKLSREKAPVLSG